MSFERRFELPTWEDVDIDLTVCEECEYKDCGCKDGEDCKMEELECNQ